MQNHPVYIIDDDRAMRSSVEILLQTVGMRFQGFADPFEFLRMAESLPPGCVLTDVSMPGMSGLELQAELIERSLRWPVIIMSGNCRTHDAIQALAMGAVAVLEKPFQLEALMAALATANEALDRTG